jgi:hypothetical protein
LSAERDTAFQITISRSEYFTSNVFAFDSVHKEKTYTYDLTTFLRTFTTTFLDNETVFSDSITTNLSQFRRDSIYIVFSSSVDFGKLSQITNGRFGVYYLPDIIYQSEFITVRYYY